jgi:tetratricopeptide (TPR) repeat protein
MKHVEGRALDKVIAEKKTLAERLALLPHVIDVADALAYAHSNRVIHRDLKPANVLVGAFGETVVIDWGLAKDLRDPTSDDDDEVGPTRGGDGELTVLGHAIGTPAYMPPEQARGEVVDERADVYALGAMLYHLLVGAMPFADTKPQSAQELLSHVTGGAPTALDELEPDAPPELRTIVHKAMARDAAARYSTAEALAEDLRRFETGQLVSAHEYSTGALLRRWVRRHRASVGIAAVAVIALATVGVISVQRISAERSHAQEQQKIAEKNRAEVEGLFDFMLIDLHTKLAPIGKLELLDMVARKATAYYAQRGVEEDSPETARNRLAALVNAGDVLREKGDLAGALEQFHSALASAQQMVEREPDDLQLRHELAVGHERVGDTLQMQGDLDGALAKYRIAHELLAELAAKDPSSRGWRLEAALARARIGDVLRMRGDLSGAFEQHRLVMVTLEELVAEDPADVRARRQVSLGHTSLGDVLREMGDLNGAFVELSMARAIAERMAEKDPTNTQWQRDVAVNCERLGGLLQLKGDLDGALENYRTSLASAKRLAERDPSNTRWQRDLSFGHANVGAVLQARGDLDSALEELRAALAIHERLVNLDSSNADWQRDIAVIHRWTGAVLAERSTHDEAVQHYRSALAVLEPLAKSAPGNVQLRNDVAATHLQLAALLKRRGETEAARQLLRRCGDSYAATGSAPDDFYNAACCYGQVEDIDRGFAMLDKAIDLGYRNADWMEQDADLAPLRTDPRWKATIERARAK